MSFTTRIYVKKYYRNYDLCIVIVKKSDIILRDVKTNMLLQLAKKQENELKNISTTFFNENYYIIFVKFLNFLCRSFKKMH